MNKENSNVEVSMAGNVKTWELDNLEKISDKDVEKNNEEFSEPGNLDNQNKPDNQERNTEIPEANKSGMNDGKTKSYANMVKSNEAIVNKNLIFIAPKVTEDGIVKVLFDEEIISKGCTKWKFTICGQFIGQNMSFYELRYHARRMWGRFGLKDVIVNNSAKWDPEIGMEKAEPKVLPI
ncbi:hypothetical protein Tco_1006076 [Tanacetum coccineum]|uniref:DUF4283 domain-containing protein n=1 Tax=Tanacetum coccineum TaxID=301880 RepID=A0ABQ5FHM6_9ASTR